MVESQDNVAECVQDKMHKIAQEKSGKFKSKKAQKEALAKAFGICRSEKAYVDKYDTEDSIASSFKGLTGRLASFKTKLAEKKERKIAFHPYTPVASKNIAGIEYSDAMLKVTFQHPEGDREYGYDVGPDFFAKMEKASSKGSFLWDYLRGRTPGYVIDNPKKMTPGGVGGSIVPYTKLSKRTVSPKEFKQLQKQYAKLTDGKVKVLAKSPFVIKKKGGKEDFIELKIRSLSDEITREDYYKYISDKLRERMKDVFNPDYDPEEFKMDSIPVRGHLRKGKWIGAFEKKGEKKIKPLKKRSKKSYDKFQYKDIKKKLKHLDSTLKGLRKKMDAGDEKAKKDYYILLKYRNKLADKKFKLKGEILFSKKDMVQDAIPVKGHMRGGKWVQSFERKGDKAEELKKKIKAKKLEKTPLPKPKDSKIEETYKKWKAEREGKKPEKKPKKREPGKISEEKRRKEIDRQAAKVKATPAPDPREEAVQKLIEETGMLREVAEKRIAKLMGESPAKAKEASEDRKKHVEFVKKNRLLIEKTQVLQEINSKLRSQALKHIISLFVRTLVLLSKGLEPKDFAKSFARHYIKLKKERLLQEKHKNKLLSGIFQLQQEIQAIQTKQDLVREDQRLFITEGVKNCAGYRMKKYGEDQHTAQEACIKYMGVAKKASIGRKKREFEAGKKKAQGVIERKRAEMEKRKKERAEKLKAGAEKKEKSIKEAAEERRKQAHDITEKLRDLDEEWYKKLYGHGTMLEEGIHEKRTDHLKRFDEAIKELERVDPERAKQFREVWQIRKSREDDWKRLQLFKAKEQLKEKKKSREATKDKFFRDLDNEADNEIAEREERYKTSLNANIQEAEKIIKESPKRIKELQKQISQVEGELVEGLGMGYKLKRLKEDLAREKKYVKKQRVEVKQSKAKLELNVPEKFVIPNELRLYGTGEQTLGNRAWINKLVKEYKALPSRFRDNYSPMVNLTYLNLTDTPEWKRAPRNVKKKSRDKWSGGWYSGRNQISLARSKVVRARYKDDSVICHEMGHWIKDTWLARHNIAARREFKETFKTKIKDKIIDNMDWRLFSYATGNNDGEIFAYSFTTYASGKIAGDKHQHTERMIIDGKLPERVKDNWGYTDSYPETFAFFEKYLGGNVGFKAKRPLQSLARENLSISNPEWGRTQMGKLKHGERVRIA